MRKVTPPAISNFLPEEVGASVDLAGCWLFETDTWHRYRVPSHHLMLVERGEISARTPDGAFEAHAGDLLCFRPAEQNEYATHGPTLFYQAHVVFAPPPRHRATPWFHDVGLFPVCVSLGASFDQMRRVFESFCIELQQTGQAPLLRTQAAVCEMLAIVAGIVSSGRDLNSKSAAPVDSWKRARMRIATSLMHGVNVASMAREMGMTPEHFIRQFRRHFGVSPKTYHNQNRVREATRLLRETDQSIKSVAYSLGFGDPKSLARAVRRYLGINPSDLRLAAVTSDRDATAEPIATAAPRPYPINKHILPPESSPEALQKYGDGTHRIFRPGEKAQELAPRK